jgi:hypothetical protein
VSDEVDGGWQVAVRRGRAGWLAKPQAVILADAVSASVGRTLRQRLLLGRGLDLIRFQGLSPPGY